MWESDATIVEGDPRLGMFDYPGQENHRLDPQTVHKLCTPVVPTTEDSAPAIVERSTRVTKPPFERRATSGILM